MGSGGGEVGGGGGGHLENLKRIFKWVKESPIEEGEGQLGAKEEVQEETEQR